MARRISEIIGDLDRVAKNLDEYQHTCENLSAFDKARESEIFATSVRTAISLIANEYNVDSIVRI